MYMEVLQQLTTTKKKNETFSKIVLKTNYI